MQTSMVLDLLCRLGWTTFPTSSRTDTERRKHGANIIRASAALRQALDEGTGVDVIGDSLGLAAPIPWPLLNSMAVLSADRLVPRAPGTGPSQFEGMSERETDVLYRLTLQDLLVAVEQGVAVEMDLSLMRCRESQGVHRRFAFRMLDWFEKMADEAGEDLRPPKQAIVRTTAAILEARYPSMPELIRKAPLDGARPWPSPTERYST